MVTMKDVAKRAGVSSITVSRVVNNSGYVRTETRARVEAAIEAGLPIVSVTRSGASARWSLADLLPTPFTPLSLRHS